MYGRGGGGNDYRGGRDNYSNNNPRMNNNWDRPQASGPSSLGSNHSSIVAANNNAPPPGTRPPPALDAEKTVVKFKTKVCIFWLQPKGCPYGDRCLYAHGAVELRDDMVGGAPGADPDANPRFKTRLCKWWASSGGTHCPHGVRCTYAHGRDELDRFLRASEDKNFIRNLEDNNAELEERKKAGAEFWNRNVKKDDESTASSVSNPSFFNHGVIDPNSSRNSVKSADDNNVNDDSDVRNDKTDENTPATTDNQGTESTPVEPSASKETKEPTHNTNVDTNNGSSSNDHKVSDDRKGDTDGTTENITPEAKVENGKETIVALPVETAKALGLPSHLLDSRSLALGPLRPGPAAFRDTAALNAGIPPPPRITEESERRPAVTTTTPIVSTTASGTSPIATTPEASRPEETGTAASTRDPYDRYRSPTTGDIDIRRMPPGILAQYLNERFAKAKAAAISAGMDPAMAARAAFQIQDFVLTGSSRNNKTNSSTPSSNDKNNGNRRDASQRLAALSGDPSSLLNELGAVSADENYQAALNVIIRALAGKESRPSNGRPTGNLSPSNPRGNNGNTPPGRSNNYDNDPYRNDNRNNNRYPSYGNHGYPEGNSRVPRDPRDSHNGNNRDNRWNNNRYPDEPPYDQANRRSGFNDPPPYGGGSHYDYPPGDYGRDYRGPPMDHRDYRSGGNSSMPPGGYNGPPGKDTIGSDRDYRDYRDDNRDRDWGRAPGNYQAPPSHWANGPTGPGGNPNRNAPYDYPNRESNYNNNRDWERDRRNGEQDWPRNPMDRRSGPGPSGPGYNNVPGPYNNRPPPNDWPRGPRDNERFDRNLPPNDNYRSNKPLEVIWGSEDNGGNRRGPNPEDTLTSLGIPSNTNPLFGITSSLLSPLDPSLASPFDLGLSPNNGMNTMNSMGHNVANVTTPIWGLEGTNNLLKHGDRGSSPPSKGPGGGNL